MLLEQLAEFRVGRHKRGASGGEPWMRRSRELGRDAFGAAQVEARAIELRPDRRLPVPQARDLLLLRDLLLDQPLDLALQALQLGARSAAEPELELAEPARRVLQGCRRPLEFRLRVREAGG
jgi:hypothetical protein